MGKKKRKLSVNSLIHVGKKTLIDLDGVKETYQVYSFYEGSYNCIFTDKFPAGTSFIDENNKMFVIFPQADLCKYDVTDNIVKRKKEITKQQHISRQTIDKSSNKQKKTSIDTKRNTGVPKNSVAESTQLIKKPAKKIKVHQLKVVKQINQQKSSEQEKRSLPAYSSQDNNLCNVCYKDFIIKKSSFNCWSKDHHVTDVTANVCVINKNDGTSDKKNIMVAAGYCSECKIYFILESGYRKILDYGIPMCRLSDEKQYNKTTVNNDMQLSPESILMQYGYTVSQTENYTDEVRHKVLASIIDNRIMTKNDIISYLNFFIRQRKTQDKYEMAISKWEKDRDFVNEYHLGDYAQLGVQGLYRPY